jgi:hypothetical protein
VNYWLNNQVQLSVLCPYTNQRLVNAIWISNTPAIWPSSLFLTIAHCLLICYCDVCLIWVQIIPCFEDMFTVLMKTVAWFVTMQPWLLVYQVKRTLGQFTPAQWDKDEWHPLLGPWRFIQVLTLCIVFLMVELNTFFLKFCLWVPPRNPMIVYRLILWWLIAIPTTREYNSYLQDRYSLPPSNVVLLVLWRVVDG